MRRMEEKNQGGKEVEEVAIVGGKTGRKGLSKEKRGEGDDKERFAWYNNNALINLTELV